MEFNNILKKLREEKEITQIELSKKINVSSRVLGYYESDRFPNDPQILIKLANYFEVSIDYLLGNEKIKSIKKELTSEEIKIIELYRELPRKDKDDVFEFIDMKHERSQRNKKLSSSENKKEA